MITPAEMRRLMPSLVNKESHPWPKTESEWEATRIRFWSFMYAVYGEDALQGVDKEREKM